MLHADNKPSPLLGLSLVVVYRHDHIWPGFLALTFVVLSLTLAYIVHLICLYLGQEGIEEEGEWEEERWVGKGVEGWEEKQEV